MLNEEDEQPSSPGRVGQVDHAEQASTPMSTASSVPGHVERVRAAVRVRKCADPPEGAVTSLVTDRVVTTDTTQRSIAVRARNGKGTLQYTFDAVFGEGSSQDDVYEYVAPLVTGVCSGINTTIFAYGQTGTGKTYTMLGKGMEEDLRSGVLPTGASPRKPGPAARSSAVPNVAALAADLFSPDDAIADMLWEVRSMGGR